MPRTTHLWVMLVLGHVGCIPIADLASDAGPDARSDAGNAGDAGTWCASQGAHFFCADFDEGMATLGWTNVDMSAMQGNLTLSPQYVSPPASLLSAVPQNVGTAEARVVKVFPGVPSQVHVEFDVSACAGSTTGYFELAKIHEYTPATGQTGGIDLGNSLGNYYLVLDEHGDDGGETVQQAPLPTSAIVADHWVHVALDAQLDPSNGSVTLVLDGGATPAVSESGVRTISPGTTKVELGIGLAAGGTSNNPACEVDYDNVIVDYH